MTVESQEKLIDALKYIIEDSVYLVEANSYEQHDIWRRWSKKLGYVQVPMGSYAIIGYVDNRPVAVSYTKAWYAGSNVVFFECTSEVVDYKMIEDFNKIAFPHLFADEAFKKTDTQNFHVCASFVEDLFAKDKKTREKFAELKRTERMSAFDIEELSDILSLASESPNYDKIKEKVDKIRKQLNLSQD